MRLDDMLDYGKAEACTTFGARTVHLVEPLKYVGQVLL